LSGLYVDIKNITAVRISDVSTDADTIGKFKRKSFVNENAHGDLCVINARKLTFVVSAGVVQARPYRAERVCDAYGHEKPSAYRRVEPCSIEPWEIFRITTAAKANRRVSEALPDFSLDSKESEGCNRMAQNHLLRLPQDLRSMKCVGLKVFGAGLFFQKVS